MGKSAKGSDFERTICKQLSLWWTGGERNDVFWRTAGSGAMAKTRSKSSQTAFGQYGDIQATDPVGQPLMDVFTIELKRGYSKYTFQDLLDKPKKAAVQEYEKFINQATQDHKNAKSKYWMLIVRRDRREPLVCVPFAFYSLLRVQFLKHPYIKLRVKEKSLYITPFNSFLECVTPDNIRDLNE